MPGEEGYVRVQRHTVSSVLSTFAMSSKCTLGSLHAPWGVQTNRPPTPAEAYHFPKLFSKVGQMTAE